MLLACVPVLGLQETPHFPCDRYTHIPSIALVILILCTMERPGAASPWGTGLVLAGLLGTLPIWLSAAKQQCEIWNSSDRLYAEIAAVQKGTAVSLHFLSRGVAEHLDRGEIEAAQKALEQLRVRFPQPEASRALSVYFEQAQKGPASYAITLNHQGRLALQQGETDLALERFHRALRFAPTYSEARFNLTLLYALKDQASESLAQYLWLEANKNDLNHEKLKLLRAQLAMTYSRLGDPNTAKLLLDRK